MSAQVAAKAAHLFPMRAATRYNQGDQQWNWGNKQYRGQNAPYGAIVTYWLGKKPAADSLVKVEILKDGTVIRTLKKPSADAGFNRIAWDLRMDPPKVLSDMPADSADPTDWAVRQVWTLAGFGDRIWAGTLPGALFDGTNEGIRCTDKLAFSVQYHPEASPGPTDSHYLFDRFVEMIDKSKGK